MRCPALPWDRYRHRYLHRYRYRWVVVLVWVFRDTEFIAQCVRTSTTLLSGGRALC
jgi:hypothetical protein